MCWKQKSSNSTRLVTQTYLYLWQADLCSKSSPISCLPSTHTASLRRSLSPSSLFKSHAFPQLTLSVTAHTIAQENVLGYRICTTCVSRKARQKKTKPEKGKGLPSQHLTKQFLPTYTVNSSIYPGPIHSPSVHSQPSH